MKNRNNTIDLFRFVFAIILVCFHSCLLTDGKVENFFARGQIGVEFFFVVSGFLFAVSVNKNSDMNAIDFIKKKIKGLLYAYLASWVLSFALISIFTYTNPAKLISNFFNSIYELLFIRNAGFNGYRVIPQTWFISSMLLSMFVIYPIYKKDKIRFETYLAPLLAILILGYLYHYTNSIVNPNKYMIFFYKSTLRGFSEICLGIFGYHLYTRMQKIDFTKAGKLLLTFIEIFGFLFTIIYTHKYKTFGTSFDYGILIFLFISIVIAFSKKKLYRES